MKIIQDMRDCAACPGFQEGEDLEQGTEANALEFVKQGAEVYRKV